MTVFAHSMGRGSEGAAGGVAVTMKGAAGRLQVHPLPDYGAEASQRLVEVAQRGDAREVAESLADPAVDVNFAGAVCLRARRATVSLREEAADEVLVEYEEIRTDASALFLAAHAGDLLVVRKLLVRSPRSSLSSLL